MKRRCSPGLDYSFSPPPKKGNWAMEEDELIRREVQRGNTKWSDIARKMAYQRTGKQCRERWSNHLNPMLKKSPWTNDEDERLIAAQAVMGNCWTQIARTLDGRSENEVKNRWYSALTRRPKHPTTATATATATAPPWETHSLYDADASLTHQTTADTLDSFDALEFCFPSTSTVADPRVSHAVSIGEPHAPVAKDAAPPEKSPRDGEYEELLRDLDELLAGTYATKLTIPSDDPHLQLADLYLTVATRIAGRAAAPDGTSSILGPTRVPRPAPAFCLPSAWRTADEVSAQTGQRTKVDCDFDQMAVATFLLQGGGSQDSLSDLSQGSFPRRAAQLVAPVINSLESSRAGSPGPSSSAASSAGWLEDIQRLLWSPPPSPPQSPPPR